MNAAQSFIQITTEYGMPRWIPARTIKSIEPPRLRFSVKGGYPTVEMHDPRYSIVYGTGRRSESGKVWFQDLQDAGIGVTDPLNILSAAWSHTIDEGVRSGRLRDLPRVCATRAAAPAPAPDLIGAA
jgi:hypothetical protein